MGWRKMKQFHNIHHGQRCIIACNGPSLNDIDMSLIKNEIVFSLNRGYLKKGLPTTYVVVVNRNVEDQWGNEIRKLPTKAIFSNSLSGTNLLRWTPDIPSFQKNLAQPMWQGHTVTYVALQIAHYMGFAKVGIIGCDHNFPHMGKQLTGADVNHFDPNYFPKGSKWDLPNLKMSEVAYNLAKKAFEQDKRQVWNCSTKTNLDVFPKTSLEEFLK